MLTLVTGPTVEPVTLTDVKAHLRLTGTADDLWLARAVRAARARVETVTGRQLLQATYELSLDAPPTEAWVILPRPPLLAITHVKYLDTAAAEQTWASTNYQVRGAAPVSGSTPDPFVSNGWIETVAGVSWPSMVTDTIRILRITYTAGYGTKVSQVPTDLVQAVYLLIGAMYERREDDAAVTSSAALALMTPYKVWGCSQAA